MVGRSSDAFLLVFWRRGDGGRPETPPLGAKTSLMGRNCATVALRQALARCQRRCSMSVYRTFLFAPGNHPRRTEKALSLDADAVILDLEDACPIAEKKATRDVVVAACQRPRTGLGYVRVNAMTTEFGYG